MTFFPKSGPFYDPSSDREFYEENDRHLRVNEPYLNPQRSDKTTSDHLKTGYTAARLV